MRVSYIFSKHEVFLLMYQLGINYKKFSYVCEPFFDDDTKEETLKSLYHKKFILANHDSIYIDKVISFIVNQLGKATKLIKSNSLQVYVCPNILLVVSFDDVNTNIIKITSIKDSAMLKEEFNIELKGGKIS